MNVFIDTDLEGISGIDNISQVTDTESPSYRFSLERLMLDVNAAIAGAFDGGADTVYVNDGHGTGINFIDEMLDSRAIKSKKMNFNNIQAIMQVGVHAMAGTLNAFLDHTQSSLAWHDYIVNGRKCGEIAQCAIYGGAYDIPCVMVSGDEAACVEAKQFLGDIECAVVKYAVGRNNAKLVDLDEALVKIYNAAKNGMSLVGKIRPYKPLMPMEVILELNRSDYCDMKMNSSDVERIDARTVRKIVREIKSFRDILI
jgi:D-aminopeptidase